MKNISKKYEPMSHFSFRYKGFDIFLAALQKSKIERGGTMRTMQVRKGSLIVKQIRYKRTDPQAHGLASKKATDWIDKQIVS